MFKGILIVFALVAILLAATVTASSGTQAVYAHDEDKSKNGNGKWHGNNDCKDRNHHAIKTIQVGEIPQGAAFDAKNNRVYVANEDSDSVSVIDTCTLKVKKTIPDGDGPAGIAYDTENNKLYGVSRNTGTVSVIPL